MRLLLSILAVAGLAACSTTRLPNGCVVDAFSHRYAEDAAARRGQIVAILLALCLLLSLTGMEAQVNGGTIAGERTGFLYGGYYRPFWFSVDATPITVWRNTGTTGGLVVYRDRINNVATSTRVTDFTWGYAVETGRPSTETVTLTSSNTTAIVPSSTVPGLWTYTGTGAATLTISSTSRTVDTSVTALSTTGSTVTFSSFSGSSAAQASITLVDGMLAGKNPATQRAVFTTQNHATATYVRNPSLWAVDYVQALTCASPWNSMGAGQRAGTLISPRHIIFAQHFPLTPGCTIRFVTTGNVAVDRTVTATQFAAGDLTVGLLDSDVPGTISFARYIAAADYAKLPWPVTGTEEATYPWPVPLAGFDQEEKCSVTQARFCDSTTWHNEIPTEAQRLEFYEAIISGDSGNPCFLLLGGQATIVTIWTQGGPGSGLSITGYATQINAAMTALGGGYQLTALDLSAYPSF